jgi:hypothetical protein
VTNLRGAGDAEAGGFGWSARSFRGREFSARIQLNPVLVAEAGHAAGSLNRDLLASIPRRVAAPERLVAAGIALFEIGRQRGVHYRRDKDGLPDERGKKP